MQHTGDRLRNVAIILNRAGHAVGEYAKMHLTQHERDLGLLCGAEAATFETDFGRLAVAICFDIYFSELFEAYRERGVSFIATPSYQRHEPKENLIAQAKTRAMDTGAYIIRSSYHIS